MELLAAALAPRDALPLLCRRAVRARALSACRPGRSALGGRWLGLPGECAAAAGLPAVLALPAGDGSCRGSSGALDTRRRSDSCRRRLSRSAALLGLSGLSGCCCWGSRCSASSPGGGTATVSAGRPGGRCTSGCGTGGTAAASTCACACTAGIDRVGSPCSCPAAAAAAAPLTFCCSSGASAAPNIFLKLPKARLKEALPILGCGACCWGCCCGRCRPAAACRLEGVREGRRQCSRESDRPSTASSPCCTWANDCAEASASTGAGAPPPCCCRQLRTLLCRSLPAMPAAGRGAAGPAAEAPAATDQGRGWLLTAEATLPEADRMALRMPPLPAGTWPAALAAAASSLACSLRPGAPTAPGAAAALPAAGLLAGPCGAGGRTGRDQLSKEPPECSTLSLASCSPAAARVLVTLAQLAAASRPRPRL